jgi:pimeloyl-ACP methyl ester carboxylesterase
MRERSITFGANDGLVGTITVPDSPAASAPVGFVLFNAGVIHRVGPHRINVRAARQLAARGTPSIRFDLAGHGDSARLTGQYSFEEQAVVDIRSAMDALRSEAGAERFAIFGLCSGAYHGFATALADERVVGLLMFDAYRYPTYKTHVYHYLKGLRERHLARRVAGFLRRGIASLAQRARPASGPDPAAPPPELGRINFIPSKAEFAAGLTTLLGRGVRIAMVYSGGEIRNYNYQNQFRDTFAPFGIADRISATFLPDVDHQASTLADQADLIRLILAWSGDLLEQETTALQRPA